MEFSLLIPVYHKENAQYFHDALISVWDSQTLKPDEIVVVEDGPLTDELDQIIHAWEKKLQGKLIVIRLAENIGLGGALQHGLNACSHEIVARMDSDDLSVADRFETQINVLKNNRNLDLVGGHVAEFDTKSENLCRIKSVPLTHQQIVRFSKMRNPFNHPTVMFRKESVARVGGYKELAGMEDYLLWVRMILAGSELSNLDTVLVKMRAGYGLLARRGGLAYARQELKLQSILFHLKYINLWEFFRNILVRIPVRILPNLVRLNIYKLVRKLR